MEGGSGGSGMRLVGLPEGAEGSNAAGFLRVDFSRWIPSLKGCDIEIGRAHRVCGGGEGAPVGLALSSSVCWDGMTNRRSWEVLGGLVQ